MEVQHWEARRNIAVSLLAPKCQESTRRKMVNVVWTCSTRLRSHLASSDLSNESCHQQICRVPTRTGKTGKPGQMGRYFPVRKKSRNFEETRKVRENHTKYGKSQGISEKFYLFFSDI